MLPHRPSKLLRNLGIEFWLPLPLVGVLFWAGSGWLSDRQLHRLSKTEPLQLTNASQSTRGITAIAINIESNSSIVTVVTTSSRLKTFTLKLPITQKAEIKTVISQILGLSESEVESLIQHTRP